MYFWDANEEVEFQRRNGQLCLLVIHRNHAHQGMKPHAHILNLSQLSIGKAEVESEMNKYCHYAKDMGEVIPYP